MVFEGLVGSVQKACVTLGVTALGSGEHTPALRIYATLPWGSRDYLIVEELDTGYSLTLRVRDPLLSHNVLTYMERGNVPEGLVDMLQTWKIDTLDQTTQFSRTTRALREQDAWQFALEFARGAHLASLYSSLPERAADTRH